MGRARAVTSPITKTISQTISAVKAGVRSAIQTVTKDVKAPDAKKLQTATARKKTTLGQKAPAASSPFSAAAANPLLATGTAGIEEKARTRKSILGA